MSGEYRVLLVNPRATYAFEIAQKCYPPLNLLYLATALRRHHFATGVLDANALALTDEQIVERVRGFGPHLVGAPLYTEILAPVYRMVKAIAEALW